MNREYLLKRIADDSVVDPVTGCWIWTKAKSNGYGMIYIHEQHQMASTHRVAYKLLVGPIPAGLNLDHEVCDRKACCNPAHLVPKTSWENARRSPLNPAAIHAAKTHCIHGHEFTEANIYRHPKRGHRHCRTCGGMRQKAIAPIVAGDVGWRPAW
jgi:hypothetical protein